MRGSVDLALAKAHTWDRLLRASSRSSSKPRARVLVIAAPRAPARPGLRYGLRSGLRRGRPLALAAALAVLVVFNGLASVL